MVEDLEEEVEDMAEAVVDNANQEHLQEGPQQRIVWV